MIIVGTKVRTITDTEGLWPGVVVSVFRTTKDEVMCVVEHKNELIIYYRSNLVEIEK